MLADRIISTIRFFDLQSMPLTAAEVFKYLIGRPQVDLDHELLDGNIQAHKTNIATVLKVLEELVRIGNILQSRGFYFLPGKDFLVQKRLRSFTYKVVREKRIARYMGGVRHIPFIRGVGLAGSQAFGVGRKESDIDLFVITDHRFMWLARTLITAYFQLLGMRRYSEYIPNRFCLNHYFAAVRPIGLGRNLYTALEYGKLRPLVYAPSVYAFQKNNAAWLEQFFPHITLFIPKPNRIRLSRFQQCTEWLLVNRFGFWLERQLAHMLRKRIKPQKHIVTTEDELSFHPNSKQDMLLAEFYKFEKQEQGVTVQSVTQIE